MKRKNLYFGLLAWYPLLSSLLMLLIWEWGAAIGSPFCGMIYFRMTELLFLYTSRLPSAALFLVLGYLLLLIFLIVCPILFCIKKRPIFFRIPSALFLLDTALIVISMYNSGVRLSSAVHLSEHLVYVALCVWLTLAQTYRRRKEKARNR